jgi:8-oxo-dGTP diphosphatase
MSDSEARFLAGYDPESFPPVAVTVDVVVLTIRDGQLHVLLVRRGGHPYRGCWALPGGFTRADEDLTAAAARELAEETGQACGQVHLEQLATYGTPGRDPRMRVVSVAYLAFAPGLPDPVAGDDAAAAEWVPVSTLGLDRDGGPQHPSAGRRLAFDHARIIADGIERARAKLEYTSLATAFTGGEFTIPELRAVYETVWDQPLHASNFYRKVTSSPGFVEPTGTTAPAGGPDRGPRARLYRPGGARFLHPELARPGRNPGVYGTSGGAELAGELVKDVAGEAEAGYDPAQLRPRTRRAGRSSDEEYPGDH